MVDEDVMKNTFPSNGQDVAVERARCEHPESRISKVKRFLAGSVPQQQQQQHQNGSVSGGPMDDDCDHQIADGIVVVGDRTSSAAVVKMEKTCKPRKRKERQESVSLIFQERKVIRSNSEERPTDASLDIRRVSSHEDFKKKQPLQVHNTGPKSPTICEIAEIAKEAASIKIKFQIDEFKADEECEHERRRVAERFSRPLSCRGRRNYVGRKRKEKRAKENGYMKSTINKEKISSKNGECKLQQQQQQQIHIEPAAPNHNHHHHHHHHHHQQQNHYHHHQQQHQQQHQQSQHHHQQQQQPHAIVVDDAPATIASAHSLFLPPKQQAEERERTPSPVNTPISPVLDLNTLHEQIDCSEPVLSATKRQIIADTEEDVAMITNRILSSPRNSIIMTRRIYLDRDVPMTSTSLNESAKNPVEQRLSQLSKQISSTKRKIKRFEEEYEKRCGYKPSHTDKLCDNTAKSLYVELNKLKKEHKQLKCDPASVVFGIALKSSSSMLSLEGSKKTCLIQEAFVDVEKQLADKRNAAKRSDNLEDMTNEQLADEKVAIQKALLHLESTYGRPTNKEDRDCVRPLYDRYRSLKRLIARISMTKLNSSLNELATIHEHETSEFSPVPTARNSETDTSRQALSTSSTDSDTGTSLSENLHSLSLDELKEQQRTTSEERKNLRRALKEFEHDFQMKNGRKLQKEDKSPMETTYNSYKTVKAKLRLLDALLDKYKKSIDSSPSSSSSTTRTNPVTAVY